MRLLFVENHATFAGVVTRAFLAGHDVTLTASVAGALALLRSHSFDAALVDYDLDDGLGSDLVRTLRARGSRLPIVAVSSRPEGNAELVRAGADAVCGKLQFARIGAVLARFDPAPRAAPPN